jgi:hypothetical protein
LQGATCEIRGGGLDTVVQCWVKLQGAHAGVSDSGCQTKVPGAVPQTGSSSELDDSADRLAFMYQIEPRRISKRTQCIND